MRVLFLERQPCVRALKYARALRDARPDLTIAFAYQGRTFGEWYGSGDETIDPWWHLGADPHAGLRAAIDALAPDVIHSHNLPDELTTVALDLVGGRVPIVHDVHDMQSLRQTAYDDGMPAPDAPLELERRALEGADAIIVVSGEQQAEIEARYRPRGPIITFPNYALADHMPARLPPADRIRRGAPRVVYQGTLTVDGGHYDLRELFLALSAQDVAVDVFPGRSVPEYVAFADRVPGLRILRRLAPEHLVSALLDYDWGWAGFNAARNGPHIETVLPNKAFDYLAAGVPVVTLRHRALARFVEEHGVGVVVDTTDELRPRLEEVDPIALRRRVRAERLRLTVEANIGRVIGLYEELVG